MPEGSAQLVAGQDLPDESGTLVDGPSREQEQRSSDERRQDDDDERDDGSSDGQPVLDEAGRTGKKTHWTKTER
jgi:hypothetical protein